LVHEPPDGIPTFVSLPQFALPPSIAHDDPSCFTDTAGVEQFWSE
jgi:hypothetical protein